MLKSVRLNHEVFYIKTNKHSNLVGLILKFMKFNVNVVMNNDFSCKKFWHFSYTKN